MAYPYQTQGFTLDNSGRRIVVDPVTRIEGHMRCEVNIDSNNVITNAVSTGTMWRGLEVILKGRDPRDAWAFVERICGVCTGTHALTSIRAVENALGIAIPDNANCIRNMMQATLHVHDHLVHFYHLHALDWVDVVAALKADPHQTSAIAQSLSAWPLSSPGYFRDLQNRLKRFIESGQLGPFRNGYWGHPAMKLPPEANLLAVAHYLEALDFQKEIVKIHTVFGGKNPHPNWLVGGVPCAINLDETGAVGAVNMERLNLVSSIIQKARQFCEQVYLPDVLLIASYYKDWAKIGGGLSSMNLLAYGEFPDNPNDYSASNLLLPRGAIINGRFDEIHPVDLTAPDEIQEFVTHSWYTYGNGNNDKGLHPWDGLTEPQLVMGEHYKGTKTFIEQVDESAKYSWIKSPRWKGHAMEVGPLAMFRDEQVPAYLTAKKLSLHQTSFSEVLALLQLTGGQLSEIVLIGVQPECLDDYGGSLTPQVKAQLMPAVYLAQEVLAQWGITASSAALPTERLNHYSLCMERYEDERPDAQSACRVGDIRVLQREKS